MLASFGSRCRPIGWGPHLLLALDPREVPTHISLSWTGLAERLFLSPPLYDLHAIQFHQPLEIPIPCQGALRDFSPDSPSGVLLSTLKQRWGMG